MSSSPLAPIIVAHRGLHETWPENSAQAVEAAYRAGFPWIECDVHASRDGFPIVMHDPTLDRTTTITGRIADLRFEELRRVRLRMGGGREAFVAGLRDLWIPGGHDDRIGQVQLMVEVKPPDARGLVREVVAFLREVQSGMLQSFDEANVLHALAESPDLPVAMLVENSAALERAVAAGWRQIHSRHDLVDAPLVRQLHAAGRKIGVWTPNTEPELRRAIELGVDVLITDQPLLARRLAQELCA